MRQGAQVDVLEFAAGRDSARKPGHLEWQGLEQFGHHMRRQLAFGRSCFVLDPKGESKAKVPFTVPEVNKILKACPNEEWRTLVHLGFYTGGRIGDCLDLLWESFDLGAEPSVTFRMPPSTMLIETPRLAVALARSIGLIAPPMFL